MAARLKRFVDIAGVRANFRDWLITFRLTDLDLVLKVARRLRWHAKNIHGPAAFDFRR